MRQHFLDDYDFNDINTIDQTWDYLQNGLINNLYQEPIQDTIMISKPRLRIQKVNSKSCPRQENEKSKTDKEQEPQECYGTYDPEHESTEPLKGMSGTAGQYAELGGVFLGRDYWGKTTPWVEHYHAGGYVTYLPKNDYPKASKKIEELKTAKWLDNGTRLLVIGMFFIHLIRY